MKLNVKKSTCALKETIEKQHLQVLHSKYVRAPTDKATGNVAFISQRLYVFIPVEELGLFNNNNINQTYKQVSNSTINIMNNHSNSLKSK